MFVCLFVCREKCNIQNSLLKYCWNIRQNLQLLYFYSGDFRGSAVGLSPSEKKPIYPCLLSKSASHLHVQKLRGTGRKRHSSQKVGFLVNMSPQSGPSPRGAGPPFPPSKRLQRTLSFPHSTQRPDPLSPPRTTPIIYLPDHPPLCICQDLVPTIPPGQSQDAFVLPAPRLGSLPSLPALSLSNMSH